MQWPPAPLIIDGQDGVERRPPMDGHDGLHAGVAATQGHDHGPVAHELRHGLWVLGADHHVDTQAIRRSQEVRRPVGASRQQ
jgi:hypothetical protein